jgi:hypothetical protein
MLSGEWIKSSRSFAEANCVEARWKASSASINGGHCTEVRSDDGVIQMRDSKDRSGPVLSFTRADWEAFIGRIKATA